MRLRLAGRGTPTDGPGAEWLARRITECAEAHRNPHFGEPIETEDRAPSAIADEIVRRLRVS